MATKIQLDKCKCKVLHMGKVNTKCQYSMQDDSVRTLFYPARYNERKGFHNMNG